MKKIDLHLHSYFSDGLCSPEELAELCHKAGLSLAALTDHDTVSGQERFLAAAAALGISAISGIEFSTDYEGQELHILGYCIDCKNENLIHEIGRLRHNREERAPKMIERLRSMGFEISQNELELAIRPGKSIGRPEIAEILKRHGYVSSWEEAFAKYIGKGCPGFVEKENISAEKCIQLINEAGGFAFWAHPALEKGMGGEKTLRELISFGLSGVEAYYAKHTPAQAAYYASLAAKYGLLTSSGSDFHKPDGDIKHAAIGSRSFPCSAL